MFGSPVAFTVPDLDRTDYLVVIGANPLVSNGSLATAADFPGKLRALRKRGGKLVVIDPARTRTAELADRHIAPRPGHRPRTDARRRARALRRGPGRPRDGGRPCQRCRRGPRRRSGFRAGHRRRRTAESPRTRSGCWPARLAAAPTAAVYGRIGTSTVEFGTLGSWLVDVINVLTGNLDRPGGAMFPLGADGARASPAEGRPRVSGSGAGTAGSPVIPKRCRNSRRPRSPRRSTPPATDRSRR